MFRQMIQERSDAKVLLRARGSGPDREFGMARRTLVCGPSDKIPECGGTRPHVPWIEKAALLLA